LSGTKTLKAASWGIPVVNHLWLEDCFSQWRDISTANEKYVVFPPGVDFGTVLTEERGLSFGRVGYDQDELDAMERDVQAQESTAGAFHPRKGILKKGSLLPAQNSMASIRSTEEVENVVTLRETVANYADATLQTSVEDVSIGPYQDIDVPLDDDGHLSLSGDSGREDVPEKRRQAGVSSQAPPQTPVEPGRSITKKKSTRSRATPAKQLATLVVGRTSKTKTKLTTSRSSSENDSGYFRQRITPVSEALPDVPTSYICFLGCKTITLTS
jgi:mediator of DNA damage checkpoint protein 1